MLDAFDWVRNHAAVVAGAVVVVVAVAVVMVLAAMGAFSSKAELPNAAVSTEEAVEVTFSVTADAGWTVDSTPAIVHVKGADEETSEVDFYHAVAADGGEGESSSKVKLAEGSYAIEFSAPVNADGSTFSIDGSFALQNVDVVADAKGGLVVECAMFQIPADQVTDEILQTAVANLRTAIDSGDETLKGDAGRNILAKMEANIANNPNVSDETKVEAERVEEEADVDSAPVSTVVTRSYSSSYQGGYVPSAPSAGQGGGSSDSVAGDQGGSVDSGAAPDPDAGGDVSDPGAGDASGGDASPGPDAGDGSGGDVSDPSAGDASGGDASPGPDAGDGSGGDVSDPSAGDASGGDVSSDSASGGDSAGPVVLGNSGVSGIRQIILAA